jgi:hypothetical protein
VGRFVSKEPPPLADVRLGVQDVPLPEIAIDRIEVLEVREMGLKLRPEQGK